MNKSSEAILALKPVTFRYKKEIELNGGIMFGLIAEDVEKVAPDLVTRNEKGEAETVRYDAVNAMLLNEFLKEHKKVEAQQTKIDEQQAIINDMLATIGSEQKQLKSAMEQLKVQAAQIQAVSARIEVNRATPWQLAITIP